MRLSSTLATCPLLAAVACAATHEVVHVSASYTPQWAKEGQAAYYALPKTSLVVSSEVELTKTAEAKCHPARLPKGDGGVEARTRAYEMLELNPEKVGKESTSNTKVKAVTIKPVAVADDDHLYAVRMNRRSLSTDSLALSWSDSGTLKGATSASTDQAVTFATEVVKAGAEVLAAVAPLPALPAGPNDACIDAAMRIIHLRNLRQRAYDANGPYDDDAPHQVGPAPIVHPDGVAKVQKGLEAAEAEALVAFVGKRKVTTGHVVCRVVPKAATNSPTPLFGRAKDGVRAVHSSCRFPASIEAKTTTVATVSLTLTPEEDERAAQLAKWATDATTSTDMTRSYFYRIPVFALAEVGEKPASPFASLRLPVAQFGAVASLPRLKGKSAASLTVTLDSETGALVGLSSEASAPDLTAVVGALNDATSTVLSSRPDAPAEASALEAAQEAQALAEAELARTTAELELEKLKAEGLPSAAEEE